MAGGGYDIGAGFSGSSSSTASNSGANQVKGGGVNFIIADRGSSASGSSSTKTLLTVTAIVVGVGLVAFVAWRMVKK